MAVISTLCESITRLVLWLLGVLVAAIVVITLAGPGCRDEAPAEGPPAPSARTPQAPPAGVWFVDRAREFGLDVVTRCGSPDKVSVLDSIGTGVALRSAAIPWTRTLSSSLDWKSPRLECSFPTIASVK